MNGYPSGPEVRVARYAGHSHAKEALGGEIGVASRRFDRLPGLPYGCAVCVNSTSRWHADRDDGAIVGREVPVVEFARIPIEYAKSKRAPARCVQFLRSESAGLNGSLPASVKAH